MKVPIMEGLAQAATRPLHPKGAPGYWTEPETSSADRRLLWTFFVGNELFVEQRTSHWWEESLR